MSFFKNKITFLEKVLSLYAFIVVFVLCVFSFPTVVSLCLATGACVGMMVLLKIFN